MNNEATPLSSHFGENIFSFELMRDRLPREFYDKLTFAIRNHRPISPETADVIAQAMKEWAVSRGTTHYTHWFQPLTGLTAEKHESFLTFDEDGRTIDRFSGRELIMSEPDASSFPHGGLRSTFEARGYAAWDPSSPAFLMRRGETATLCLPSVFVSYKGEVLDKKTPLLRSIAAVSKAAVKLLRLLGNKRVTGVMPYLGAEQEYFLVDRDLFLERPDLREVGATLLGAGPARGQQLEDHYFRAIGDRVLAFMEDVERELVRLGVPVKTRHNEVAPGQFELAVLHRPVNIAADQNQLVMEMLRRVAPRHGFEALLHEKPFARVNGSGKHNNWSLIDSEGTNLLEPGTNASSRLRFLIFLMATVWGVHRHGALLRAIVAGPGNELRLGGNEAPPSIISVHLGDHLSKLIESVAEATAENLDDLEEIDLGLAGVARIPRDTTDRNRTSPFAFTGNKFEFRAVGSTAAVSLPNAVINSIVAESLELMSSRLKELLDRGETRNAAALEVLRDVIRETQASRFDGDNYTDEWAAEAEKRGLPAAPTTPEALDALLSESTHQLFERFGLLTREENDARYRIWLDLYIKTVGVELNVVRQMLATQVLPAAIRYQERIAASVNQLQSALGTKNPQVAVQRTHLEEISGLIAKLIEEVRVLEKQGKRMHDAGELRDVGLFCAKHVRPKITAAREIADRLEELVADDEWPLPSYDELLTL